jgi:tetratricopeptide (TPR) repeat protein
MTGVVGCGPTLPTNPVAMLPVSPEADIKNEIEFHRQRVKTDPKGALGFAMLSESYLRLANLKDDDNAAVQAETAARQSLAIRKTGNARAARRLTEALLHQHRFVESEESARLATQLSNYELQAVRQLADVLLELGKYSDFRTLTKKYPAFETSPEGKVTLARWNEVLGKPQVSLMLLKSAVKDVEALGEAGRVPRAWFRTQLGWTALRNQDMTTAKTCFETALRENPSERKANFGLAALAFESRDYKNALSHCEKSLSVAPLTDVLALKVKAHIALNQTAEAANAIGQIRELNKASMRGTHDHAHIHGKGETQAKGNHARHTHSRLFAKFLADSGRDLRAAHHMAEEDLQWRKDIHAYDTFAWATYRFWKLDPAAKREEGDGLLREAQVAIKQALSTGTQDAEIRRHAQQILVNP